MEAIRPHGDWFEVVLGLAPATTGNEPSQLVNMLFGNCSLQPEVELIDVEFPEGYAKAFPGPRFGIDGIRRLPARTAAPLTCTALKPQGSTVEHLARLARTFALAGIDVIKDDHGLANQAFSPFAERVPAVQRAVDEGQPRDRRAHALRAHVLRRRRARSRSRRASRRRAACAWRSWRRC